MFRPDPQQAPPGQSDTPSHSKTPGSPAHGPRSTHSPRFAALSQKHHGASDGQSSLVPQATRAFDDRQLSWTQTRPGVLQVPPGAQTSLAGIMSCPGPSQASEQRCFVAQVTSVPVFVAPRQHSSSSGQSDDSSQEAVSPPDSLQEASAPFFVQVGVRPASPAQQSSSSAQVTSPQRTPLPVFETGLPYWARSASKREGARGAAERCADADVLAASRRGSLPPLLVRSPSRAGDFRSTSDPQPQATTSAMARTDRVFTDAKLHEARRPCRSEGDFHVGSRATDFSVVLPGGGTALRLARRKEALEATFFSELQPFSDFVQVANAAHYREVPSDWLVVITDVRGSTKAIEAGQYKNVNALGVASIVALRNAVRGADIPFVFGGDGATLLLPGAARAVVEASLRGVKAMARTAFDMEMRTAIVPVAELIASGHPILVARFEASADIHLAMFRGSGLSHAEKLVKGADTASRYAVSDDGPAQADFTGFECRWEPIPSRRGVVASLLVQARAETEEQADRIYEEVVTELAALLEDAGRPVAAETLALQGAGGDFDAEARIRSGSSGGLGFRWRRFRAAADAVIGAVLLSNKWRAAGFPGDVYRDQVVANTDFRKFDETLRLVVDVSADTLERVRRKLEGWRAKGAVVYGIHESGASIMTCAIQAYEGRHVHFVDGADGGYALAAKQMKAQLAR